MKAVNLAKNDREVNLDILKIIAMISIILIHIGSLYAKGVSRDYPEYYFTIGNFFHTVTRFAVPTFVLISGGFLISNEKNLEFKVFYKKTIKRIVIPTLIFSFLYVIYSIIIGELYSKVTGDEYSFIYALIDLLKGNPFYHMWYMYMIIGMYFITPILIKLRIKSGDKKFLKLGIIILVFNMIGNFIDINLFWPIQFIRYLGYFILGYSLKKNVTKKIKAKKVIIFGALICLLVFFIVELGVRLDLNFNYTYFMQPRSITMAISSILIYIGFLGLDGLNIKTRGLEKHTFNIYLLHAGVLSAFDLFFRNLIIEYPNPILYFPVMFIVGFLVSYFISKLIINKFSFKTVIK